METGHDIPKTMLNAYYKPHDTRWNELKPIPDGVTTHLVYKLNEQQLIFASDGCRWNGLYVHNLHLQEFREYIQYPNFFYNTQHCLQFDSSSNRFYGSAYMAPFFSIDLDEGKFVAWDPLIGIRNPLKGRGCGNLLNVNGDIHLIGGYDNNKHLVWNEEIRNFSEIHKFKFGLVGTIVLYVPKKDIIIMIRGCCETDDNILWEYGVKTKKWRKNKIWKFRQQIQCAVLTTDEKYIIMSSIKSQYIHVLRIDDYEFYRSSVKIPCTQPHFIVQTGGIKDHVLVVGWIKWVFKSSEFRFMEEPPMYLMTLISHWYNNEQIHWIGKYYDRHFVIDIKHIFSSLTVISNV